MCKTKKIIACVFCAAAMLVAAFACMNTDKTVSYAEADGGTAEPYALESLKLTIDGGNGTVIATAKNTFQLGHSTVLVYLYLYYSYSYCEDYNQMTLAASNSIADLDSGNSITAEAATGGEERYWLAVMRYRVNSGDWKEKTVGARCSAAGEFLGAT